MSNGISQSIQLDAPEVPQGAGVIGIATLSGDPGVIGYSFGGANWGSLGEDNYGVHGVVTAGTGPAVSGVSAATPGVKGVNGGGTGQPLPPLAGVIGDSGTGHGVYGVSNSTNSDGRYAGGTPIPVPYSGVMGIHSDRGTGVTGVSNKGNGVYALSYNNHAIYARGGVSSEPASGANPVVTDSAGNTVYAAMYAEGSVHVTGDVNLLGNGQDCAEQFDAAVEVEIDPGTVVSCDGEDSLRESQEEYDKKVAGVVSGAGGCRPGIVLGKRPSSKIPVQVGLIGKVYCKVDAQYGSIRVGDLLTTSATPGHAMKATDAVRAFGAVIGKALRDHDAGRGLIPILIALQ